MRWVQKLFRCDCAWKKHILVPQDELGTMLTVECPECKQQARRQDLQFNGSTKAIMDAVHAEGGVRIFEDGKRKTIGTKRGAEYYAAKNGLVFGGDDLEQESAHNKQRLDSEYTERTTTAIMNDFERLQYAKNNNR